MVCYAVNDNQLKPVEGNSGSRPFCVATLAGSFIGDNTMKQIDVSTPTHPNTFALVDDKDFEWLNQWKWHAAEWNNGFYVIRSQYIGGGAKNPKFVQFKMHRLIMNTKVGLDVDHIDGNGLNNTRVNLRNCTRTQNLWNSKPTKGGISKYKGVTWQHRQKKWQARINVNSKRIFLGYHFTEVEAAKAYDRAAKKYHGEFANTNF